MKHSKRPDPKKNTVAFLSSIRIKTKQTPVEKKDEADAHANEEKWYSREWCRQKLGLPAKQDEAQPAAEVFSILPKTKKSTHQMLAEADRELWPNGRLHSLP